MSVPREVLIVRLGAIGDVTNALCVAKALKALPTPPKIGWVVHDLAAPLLENNPLVDRVHLWPRRLGLGGLRGCLASVRAESYELAIDLQRIFKSAAFARFAGTGRVLGWDRARAKEGAWLLASERLAAGHEDVHMVDSYGEFARHLGAEPCGPKGVLALDPAATEFWLAEAQGWHGPAVVINLGASKAPNRWPAERFGSVAAKLCEDGYQVLFTGGPDDRAAARDAHAIAGPGAIDLTGKTSLPELAALLNQARLFVGCDTGPMHMAVAMGCRVLALFGPANPLRTGPYGSAPGCRVLQHTGAPGGWRAAQTTRITEAEVLEAARMMLTP